MKKERFFFLAIASFWISYLLGFSLTCLTKGRFDFRYLLSIDTFLFFLLFFFLILAFLLWYYWRHYWLFNSRKVMKGNKEDRHLSANLEEARFQSEEEIAKNFSIHPFGKLKETDVVGSPIRAYEKEGKLEVTFAKPSHALVIGTTGSGKTTTYVSPLIQILSETKTKPSFFISDPKGELLQSHRLALEKKGYEIKIIDLRNPYNSTRRNPMERPYLMYQKAIHLQDEVIEDEERGCYLFDGKEYWSEEEKESALQVEKQKLLDEVYEDLNDISTSICPVVNKNEPMWESGAKNLILAIALAMLEDSADERNGMSKEKYNFYSLMKVATSTDDDCKELIDYFKGRSPLSRAVSLSKQVMDASDKTRGSYLSSCFDKLSIFSDMSLCALTSENEIEFGSMGEKPIALFLQIPDEKETRHTLASLLILQAYKELVRKANSNPNLTLEKPVYFILDEFGNLPKVHKLEQMITVGRSRNIWMNLIVQSYSQLAKVYDEKSADIIKSNCNIQIFIGTTDLKTIEDFSKRCGNYFIVLRSVGFNSVKGDDINSNQSVKERPLIYPSELQTLNKSGDMGHAIVTVFGYQPIRSLFTPCFECKEYDMEKTIEESRKGRFFDEKRAFYDLRSRNRIAQGGAKDANQTRRESTRNQMILLQIVDIAEEGVEGIMSKEEKQTLIRAIKTMDAAKSLNLLRKADGIASKNNDEKRIMHIQEAVKRIKDLIKEDSRKTQGGNE